VAHTGNGITPPAAALYPPPATTGNPYLTAQEEWDRRTGTYLQWIRRLLWGLGLLAGAVVALVAYAWVAPGKVQYIPYVVEVSTSGEIRAVGIIPHGWSSETKAPIDFVVRDWLAGVRTITDSKIGWGKQWDRARAFMTTKTQQKMSDYAYSRDQMQKMGQVVDIEITSILPTASDWQLITAEWTEKTYSQQGMLIRSEPWKANLQVAIFPPDPKGLKTPDQFRNTVGIFITGYQWGIKTTGKMNLANQGGK
jgi:type IV secretory pathway TrbF-like protein